MFQLHLNYLEQTKDEAFLIFTQNQIIRFEQEAFVNAEQPTPLNEVVNVVPGKETLRLDL